MTMDGCVFDIQRFSVHDGPGIRTTVFLKGCPLHCLWCSNPESQHSAPEMLFNEELCIGCDSCVQACPSGAIEPGRFLPERCTGCGACCEVCYAEARFQKGQRMTPEAVLETAVRDRSFYARTGGGVTFSGGEPLCQIEFLTQALQLCRAHGIGTAIESCGCASWEDLERIAPLVDVFLYDIKHLDREKHRQYTGGDCAPILENCRRLARIANRLVVRVPVIPTFNFELETLTQIVRFAEQIGAAEVDFLPYHRMAENKYRYLGRDYWNPGVERLTADQVEAVTRHITSALKIKIGG